MLEMETGIGYKKPTEGLHKDPMLMAQIPEPEIDPLAEARHQAILDQISQATPEQLASIQRNKAAALKNKENWMEDQRIVDIVNAVYRRSRELFEPQNNNPETLH